ncbi:MAG: diacylglycerol kinase family lipid kinase [Oscillospiraceae bacterium]|nr:diacylglycerol kinase family lipid kinase [Oscillospiraceae bacterium]
MIYFIINPAAGSGKTRAAIPIIERVMRESGVPYTLIYTNSPDECAKIEKQIDWDAAKAIVCVGGDGTVQEYIGLAVNRDISFAVIPTGSANDFLYSVPGGYSKSRTFEETIIYHTKKLLAGNTLNADAVSVSNAANQRYFFNIGGTGIDIQVLRDALPLKKAFGGAAYFLSLIKNAVTYRAEKITLHIDGKPETGRYILLAAANGAYYGGKMNVAPTADIADGFITLCKVVDMPRLKLLALFPSVKPGRHIRMKEVSLINCKEIILEYGGKKTINFDGNLYEFESPLAFRLLPGAVKLII